MSIFARASQAILKSLATSRNGLVTTTYADDGIVSGVGHAVAGSVDITAGTTINFLVDLSSVDADKYVFSLPVRITSGSQDVDMKVYEGTDYAGGSAVSTFNPNRNASDTKQTVITSGATGTVKGTQFIHRHAFASNQSSGSANSYSFLILDKTKNYLIELTNEGASTTTVDYETMIFES